MHAKKIYYKLLRTDRRSLGFNGCQIIKYSRSRQWSLPAERPQRGQGPGGLWVARTKKGAKWLRDYARRAHDLDTVAWLCIGERVLWEHPRTGRTKVARLMLLDPVIL